MRNWIKRCGSCISDKRFVVSVSVAFAFLIVSAIINFYAGSYATERASNSVTDIILSNIPVFDLDGIFVYGSVIFFIFITLVCFYHPQRLPFTVKSIALFVIIRSIFISLTHIGPFPIHSFIDPNNLISKFTFGGDLFFSGHTGLPFLMALIFWEDKFFRYLFIATSVMFGIVVLMAHLHYSIDVLAAFFITYSIFKIAVFFFKKDRELFLKK
ncbi:MAG TPA: phosphatase PAP2-related protein [Candidatus Paceibacterota bacterium]|nr:phosphatase PAP2-related protein [Candidatus Paceibacterota bacterium]